MQCYNFLTPFDKTQDIVRKEQTLSVFSSLFTTLRLQCPTAGFKINLSQLWLYFMFSPKAQNNLYRVLALVIITLWGFTYISTKILYAYGLSAIDVLFLRTLLAYAALVAVAPKWFFADSTYDELKLALLGVVWVPLYYGLEHLALAGTQASTVAILLATGPLMTAFLAVLFFHRLRMHWTMIVGICSAATGVFLLWFDNQILFQLSGSAIALALGSAFFWAVYSMMLKTLSGYPLSFIARKAFGYGLLVLLPLYLYQGPTDFSLLANPGVLFNLAFLALVTMTLCAVLWNRVATHIGTASASQFLYWVPVISALIALVFLGEHISFIGVMGAAMILCGVWVAQYGIKRISAAFAVGDADKFLTGAGF